jgi:hypothetical protein
MTAWMRSMLIRALMALPFHNRPVQAIDFRDDYGLCRLARRIVARQTAGDLLQVPESHPNVKPVEKRRRGDAGVCENAPEPGTTIGESGQRGAFRSANCVKVLGDQNIQKEVVTRNDTSNSGQDWRHDHGQENPRWYYQPDYL